MRSKGLIDDVTYARGMLKADRDSGLGDVEHSSAMMYGSQEARSTLLRANDQHAQGADPLQQIAKQSRDTHAVQERMNQAIQQMHTMMRTFLGSTAPQMARI